MKAGTQSLEQTAKYFTTNSRSPCLRQPPNIQIRLETRTVFDYSRDKPYAPEHKYDASNLTSKRVKHGTADESLAVQSNVERYNNTWTAAAAAAFSLGHKAAQVS